MNGKFLPTALALIVFGAIAGAFLATSGIVTTAVAQPAASPNSNPTWAPGGILERLTPDNCVFAFIDHQTGLTNLVENTTGVTFKNYVIALAKTAKLHKVPVVLTTSASNGPNGPFLPEVAQMFPDAPMISRPGQINAWDNTEFVDAIKKTGRKKIVMSGITTDVCVVFAALSAIDAGYEVYVVVDACGSMNPDVQNASLMRMSSAGATMGTWFAISCELLYDWRKPTGPGSAELFIEHFPRYAEIFHSHQASASPGSAGGAKN